MDDWDLRLTDRIVYANKRNGFMGCITKGARGVGKSMYNLKAMALAHYRLNGGNETDAWNNAMDGFIFTPDDLLAKVEQNIADDKVSLCWCIDDAAVHFSNMLFFMNLYKNALLNATFDTIRTVVNALMVNCPDKHRLMKSLQHYDDYEVTLYYAPGYERKSVAIKWYSLPDGHRRYRKEFEDHFSCYVPNWIYDKYMAKRKSYLAEVSGELKELQEKLAKRKEKKLLGNVKDNLVFGGGVVGDDGAGSLV